MSPWISRTFFEPAWRWKPSTFWVSVQTRSKRDSISAITWWARLNLAPRAARSICPRYFQVISGRRRIMAPESASSMGMPSSVSLTLYRPPMPR